MASILKTDQIRELTPGNGVMAVNPIKLSDGSVSNPSLAFTNDSDSGLYRIDNNKIGVASNGIKVGEIGPGYGGFVGGAVQTLSSSASTPITTGDSYLLNTQFTPKLSNSLIVIFANICSASQSGVNDHRVHSIFQVSPLSTELAKAEFYFGGAGGSTTRSGGAIMALVQNSVLTSRTFAIRVGHASGGTLSTMGSYSLLIQEIMV